MAVHPNAIKAWRDAEVTSGAKSDPGDAEVIAAYRSQADAEAGFGGPLNAFELMKAMIEAGAAGVHFEDQLASEKKCGHLGGKVLVPTSQFVRTLTAARLAADVLNVPTVLVARTDALSATLLTSDVDDRDREFLTINDAKVEALDNPGDVRDESFLMVGLRHIRLIGPEVA